MDDHSHKPKQTQENLPKKHFTAVKSKYLDFTRKTSSQSDSSGPSKSVLKAADHSVLHEPHKTKGCHTLTGNTVPGNGFKAAGATSLLVPKTERTNKTSTPTKDVSLFSADLSVVPAGNDHETQKRKEEDPVKLSDKVFEEYNKALLLQAWRVLIDEHQAEFAKTADTQLTILTKAVEESACTLSNLQHQIDITTCLDEIQEDLATAETVIKEIIDEPVFSDPKCFEDLAAELEGVLDQLPCKNVRVPSSQEDLDEIQNAAGRLSDELTSVLEKHGGEMELVSGIKDEMSKIDSICNSLSEANSSIKELMPIATTKVLDITSKSMMSSTLANMDIKF